MQAHEMRCPSQLHPQAVPAGHGPPRSSFLTWSGAHSSHVLVKALVLMHEGEFVVNAQISLPRRLPRSVPGSSSRAHHGRPAPPVLPVQETLQDPPTQLSPWSRDPQLSPKPASRAGLSQVHPDVRVGGPHLSAAHRGDAHAEVPMQPGLPSPGRSLRLLRVWELARHRRGRGSLDASSRWNLRGPPRPLKRASRGKH